MKKLQPSPAEAQGQSEARTQPDTHRDPIKRGAAVAGGVVPLVGRIDDRFYPGIEKSQPGAPIERRWSCVHYFREQLAERDAQTMAILAAEGSFIQVDVVSPSVVSLDEQHKGNYVVGSRIENGVLAYYISLQSVDWGNSSLGVWGKPYVSQQQAEKSAARSLEDWLGAMDNFADCMVAPGEDEIDCLDPCRP